ncbi:hypothetical protein LP419_02825 [Massilia sp. H-1]|nr:hypothetical protein LP419_02825 [Massilia sp. H-1]
MSRLRVAMVVFSGLLIAGLIAALALIAHENATAPHPLAVVAAKNEEAPVRPLRGAAAIGQGLRPSRPRALAPSRRAARAGQRSGARPARCRGRRRCLACPSPLPTCPRTRTWC